MVNNAMALVDIARISIHTPVALVVDDDPTVRSWIERMLAGRKIRVVATGDSATAVFQAYLRKPDVAVIDVALRDDDGITLARKLRSLFPELPVIFISAQVGERKLAEVHLGWPKPGFLAKPLVADALWGIMSRHLAT